MASSMSVAWIVLLAIIIVALDCNPSLFVYNKIFPPPDCPSCPSDFRGKTVWITGATSGIGRELATVLGTIHRANLIISGRREDELKKLRDYITSYEPSVKVKVLPFDQTGNDEVVLTAVEEAVKGGKIDLLVLNAGRSQRLPALSTPISATRELTKLNFESQVLIAQSVIDKSGWSAASPGHIFVTSSVAGKLPVALSSSYAASKAALNSYFQSLRSELPWLRVDLSLPGPVATPIAKQAITYEGKTGTTNEKDEVKMSVERCVALMISQMSGPEFLMYESWISTQPALFFTMLGQYMPTLVAKLAKIVGPQRMKAFDGGEDLFKFSDWLLKK